MSWLDLSDRDVTKYAVVINHEEQYSIWPVDAPRPQGKWRAVGFEGYRAEAQAYIAEVWTDMRPLSLRQALDKYGSVERVPDEVWTDMRP